jgi:hypothetical protein
MKKRIVLLLLVSVLALSFSVSVMATPIYWTQPVQETATEHEISPFTEMTRMAWRTYNGQLQWRLWSITNGRWLTDWTNV